MFKNKIIRAQNGTVIPVPWWRKYFGHKQVYVSRYQDQDPHGGEEGVGTELWLELGKESWLLWSKTGTSSKIFMDSYDLKNQVWNFLYSNNNELIIWR